MSQFTPVSSLLGGLLIGLSAAGLLVLFGRVAGISGILAGLMQPVATRPLGARRNWRLAFIGGLVGGGALYGWLRPDALRADVLESPVLLIVAGLLVGIGTRLANGCTSGHGLCGISRLSRRSIYATAVFMATGMLTVLVVGWLGRAGLWR